MSTLRIVPHGETCTNLANSASLLTKNFLGVGGTDDDVGHGRSDANLDTRVSFLGELALEELVELGVENTVGDELSALADVDAAHALGRSSGCHID